MYTSTCAGRHVGIFGARGALAHLAVDAHDPFGAQLLGDLERRAVRVGHDLRQAVMVAQIDEQHAAVVADAVAPARQPHVLADVAVAQRAAGVGTIAMHERVRNGYLKKRATRLREARFGREGK